MEERFRREFEEKETGKKTKRARTTYKKQKVFVPIDPPRTYRSGDLVYFHLLEGEPVIKRRELIDNDEIH